VFLLSVKLMPAAVESEWWLVIVYGPCSNSGKSYFLLELNDLHHVHVGPWMICDDFNMLYRAEDKNSGRVNRRLMGEIKKIHQ
jgi:hypothetical protein